MYKGEINHVFVWTLLRNNPDAQVYRKGSKIVWKTRKGMSEHNMFGTIFMFFPASHWFAFRSKYYFLFSCIFPLNRLELLELQPTFSHSQRTLYYSWPNSAGISQGRESKSSEKCHLPTTPTFLSNPEHTLPFKWATPTLHAPRPHLPSPHPRKKCSVMLSNQLF